MESLAQLKEQLEQLRTELRELEDHLPKWDGKSTAGAKFPRSVAKRIVLSAQRLETLVKEKTYTPNVG